MGDLGFITAFGPWVLFLFYNERRFLLEGKKEGMGLCKYRERKKEGRIERKTKRKRERRERKWSQEWRE